MPFHIFIAEPNADRHSIWQSIFEPVPDVTVMNLRIHTLRNQLDAEFLPGILVHDRYGGKAQLGISSIQSTRGEHGMPPWVVTTAPFPAHLEERQQPNGSITFVAVVDQPLAPAEETYIVFTKAFEAIIRFNRHNSSSPIRSLGFQPELLNLRGDVQDEAEAVQRAYLAYREQLNQSADP